MKPYEYYIYIQELFDNHLNKLFTTQTFKIYIYKLVQDNNITYIGSTTTDYSLRYAQHIHHAYEDTTNNSKLYTHFRKQTNKIDFTMEILLTHHVKCLLQTYLLEDSLILLYDATNKLNTRINNQYIYQLINSNISSKKQLIQNYLTNQIKDMINKHKKYIPRHLSYVKLNKTFYEIPLSDSVSDWCNCNTDIYPTSCIYNIKLTRNKLIESSQINSLPDTIFGIYLIIIDGETYYCHANGGFNNIKTTNIINKINQSVNVSILPLEYYYYYSLTYYPNFYNRIKEISSCKLSNIIYDDLIIKTFDLKRPKVLYVDIPVKYKIHKKILFVRT